MSIASVDAADALDRRLRRLQRTGTRIEQVAQGGSLVRADLEALYEGLYIGAITNFEQFVADLFSGILLGQVIYASRRRVVPRVDVKSSVVLTPLLNAGRPYVDWLPYRLTEERASTYFRGGRPFADVVPVEKQRMERWLWTRNAIAHASPHSNRVFVGQVIAGTPLPPRERTPAGFLRSEIRAGVTRFENVLDEMRGVAATLCA